MPWPEADPAPAALAAGASPHVRAKPAASAATPAIARASRGRDTVRSSFAVIRGNSTGIAAKIRAVQSVAGK
jgi:hypothetical protein